MASAIRNTKESVQYIRTQEDAAVRVTKIAVQWIRKAVVHTQGGQQIVGGVSF